MVSLIEHINTISIGKSLLVSSYDIEEENLALVRH